MEQGLSFERWLLCPAGKRPQSLIQRKAARCHNKTSAPIFHSVQNRSLAQRGICADLSLSANPPTGIARRAGRSPSAARKLPQQKPRSPRGTVGYGRPLKASPWECGMYDKPSGVVRGECRGGLGGAAAPNRPPSAPAGGGQINIKGNAAMPAGRMPFNRATSTNTRASTNPCPPRRLHK